MKIVTILLLGILRTLTKKGGIAYVKEFDYLVASGAIFSLLFSASCGSAFALERSSDNKKGGSFVYVGKSNKENKKEKYSKNSSSSPNAPVVVAGTIVTALIVGGVAFGVYKKSKDKDISQERALEEDVPWGSLEKYGGPPPF